jgi:hypothetical protein
MATGYFNAEQLAALYQKLDHECAAFALEHGYVTAAQRNLMAARIMEAAKADPPPKAPPAMAHVLQDFT